MTGHPAMTVFLEEQRLLQADMDIRPAILNIKFQIPNTSGLLRRPRLIDRLENISQKKMALVTAGSGYGKSTLVSQTLQEMDVNIIWYTLAVWDCDPSVFLESLITAFCHHHRNFDIKLKHGRFRSAMTREQMDILLLNILAEIESSVSRNMVLVLDDFHRIPSASPVSHIIQFLVDRLPLMLHLVIIGRTEPGISLSRLQALREIIDIGEEDLSFQPDEIGFLYRTVFHQEIRPDTAGFLYARSKGWIAGLMLIHNGLKGKSPDELGEGICDIQTTRKLIHAYLNENIFEQQNGETKSFLLETSLLLQLHPDQCDAMFNRRDSRSILNTLWNHHLLTYSVGNSPEIFQYHDLFRQFLVEKLMEEWGQDGVSRRHRVIGLFLNDRKDYSGALHHFLEGHHWEEVRHILVHMEFSNLIRCSFSVLSYAVDQIPEEMVALDPGLILFRAKLSSLKGDVQNAIAGLQLALNLYERNGDRTGAANCLKDMAFHHYLTGDIQLALNQLLSLRHTVQPDPFFSLEVAGYLVLFSSILGQPEA
ncbi:MAG: hypothetical protein WA151_16480, partial [Desulfatirhabdiaceae bacterium]